MNEEPYSLILGACCGYIIMCFMLISYVIMSIIILIKNYDTWKTCPNTSLWVYVLVSLIIILMEINCIGNSLKSEKEIKSIVIIMCIVCCILFNIGLSIWGGIELYDRTSNCTEIKESNIYILGEANLGIQLFSIAMAFVCPIIFKLRKICHRDIEKIDKSVITAI